MQPEVFRHCWRLELRSPPLARRSRRPTTPWLARLLHHFLLCIIATASGEKAGAHGLDRARSKGQLAAWHRFGFGISRRYGIVCWKMVARLVLSTHIKTEVEEEEEGLPGLRLMNTSAHADVIVAVHSHCSLLPLRARGRIRHDAMSTRPGYEGG